MARIKSPLSQEILGKLLLAGAIFAAGSSPYFWINVYKVLFGKSSFREKKQKKENSGYFLLSKKEGTDNNRKEK